MAADGGAANHAPRRSGRPWLADTYARVAAYLGRAGVAMSGPPFARIMFRDREMDVEAGFPVVNPIAGEAEIQPSTLPGGPAAVTTHYGPYEALEEAYQAVMAWIEEQGLRPRGAH